MSLVQEFMAGWHSAGKRHMQKQCVRKDKKLREGMSEDKLDKILSDSFPASDPVTFY